MIESAALTVIVPLTGALACFALRAQRAAVWCGLASAVATAAIAALTVVEVARHGQQVVPMSGWSAPLGIELRVDGFAALLLATTAAVGLAVSVAGAAWFGRSADREWGEERVFWPLWLVLWAALHATYLTADLFNAYVALELLTLAAVALVIIPGSGRVVRAGSRYFLAALGASMAYLLGVALLYGAYGTLSMPLLAERIESGPTTLAAAVLVTGGLGLKTALFPLHFWLPEAHGFAPAPVSALLSGLVIKASFCVTVRLWLEVFPGAVTPMVAQVLGIIGAVALVVGAAQAIRQDRLKMLVAYSTVSQVGLLFLVIPVAIPADGSAVPTAALAAAGFLVMAHGIAKAGLFLAAGAVQRRRGDDRAGHLGSVVRGIPLVSVAALLAGASLIGLPWTAGYVGKSLLLDASAENGQWWWSRVIDASAFLTAAYLVRSAWPLGRSSWPAPEAAPVRLDLQLAALVLGASVVVVGLWPAPLVGLFEGVSVP